MSNKPEISHILGIDFGRSRVGLAMADSETKIAFTYTTLQNDRNLLENIADIIINEQISQVIIGCPGVDLQSPNGIMISKFGEKLRIMAKVTVYYENEMFTTKMAEQNLIERGMKKIKRLDDQEAAKIILQSWLDSSGGK